MGYNIRMKYTLVNLMKPTKTKPQYFLGKAKIHTNSAKPSLKYKLKCES